MLGSDDADHDAFSSAHLWRQSTLLHDTGASESSLFSPLPLDITQIALDHPYAPEYCLEDELRLPDLDTFEFGPLAELESFEDSSLSFETLHVEPEEDVWEAAFKLGPANKHVLFYTWEGFEKRQHGTNDTLYITERGPAVFDAALAHDDDSAAAGRVLKGNLLLQSLWNLGLGRSSILFAYNTKRKTFESLLPSGRASGVSLRASQSLIAHFIHTGNTFLYLRSFAERTFTSASSLPAKVALATSVSSILSTLEDNLGKRSAKIASLIQLQHHFRKPRDVLIHIARMVDAVKHATSNEQLASILHHRLLELDEGESYLRQLSSQVLSHVAEPTMELLEEWIGIRTEEHTVPFWERTGFVTVADPSTDAMSLEYTYRSEMMPRFISPEDGNTIFETGNSLRFLRTQHPDHPLACLDGSAVQTPEFEWGFAWQDVETIAAKAKAYEQRLRQALLEFSKSPILANRPNSTHPKPTAVIEDVFATEDFDRVITESIQHMDEPPKQNFESLPNELQLLLDNILESSASGNSIPTAAFAPPLSLASSLSFHPLITAQAKLVNAATVRLFFRSHQLRLHLSLQRQYQLLGDGVFSSLLATSLFDPERESAERHKGKMRSGVHMGLQLGSRESWPPASSELRLALRGVLSESYYSSQLYHSTQKAGQAVSTSTTITGRDNDDLPGQLNFGIRNLTEAEQEKVMNPDALSALDFLRLQYVPPTPLNLVITTSALDKYDMVFKFLLRLLRMLFVVSHLPRDYPNLESRQIRLEAHHFVTTLANYVFQTGIGEHWNIFDTFVTTMETRLDEEDAAGELGVRVTEGIAFLRNAHETCLDSIMFSLLLRKRQRKIMGLVDDIFEYILIFAKMANLDAKVDQNVMELHAKLKGKVRVFLSVCRGLTGSKGYGKGNGTSEENSIERLVVAMEMNGHYKRS